VNFVVVIAAAALSSVSPAPPPTAAPTTTAAVQAALASTDPCARALDAVVPTPASPGCLGPSSSAPPVVADDTAPERALRRDPAILPAELGFLAVALGVVGGGAVAGAQAVDTRRLNDAEAWQQQAVFVSGVSLVVLAGLVGAGAAATVVFDPSKGTLRLPVFSGED
jgi:hypothetical protein